jgi:hypothetical protein
MSRLDFVDVKLADSSNRPIVADAVGGRAIVGSHDVAYLPNALWRPDLAPPVTPRPTAAPPTETTVVPTATTTPVPPPTATPSAGRLVIGELRCGGRHELVQIDNVGGAPVDLTDWRLFSVQGIQTFRFPRYSVDPGTSVLVHSGPDAPEDGGNNFRWTTGFIWNDLNDTAQIIAPDRTVVDERDC